MQMVMRRKQAVAVFTPLTLPVHSCDDAAFIGSLVCSVGADAHIRPLIDSLKRFINV